MISRFSWVWSRITGQLWVPVTLYGLAATITVMLADYAAPLVPQAVIDSIVEGTARQMLTILASSMLVVATFSLGTMVQAYAAAASLATPRATRILIGDPFSQRVLSTFLGAFVFAMVALFVQGFGYYNPAGEAVLLLATAVVVIAVIATLFGWLDHLANLVRLGETIRKVELRAAEVMDQRLRSPNIGGVSSDDAAHRWPICTQETGYIQHLDVPALQAVAERAGGTVQVGRIPGALVDPVAPLAHASWDAGPDDVAAIVAAFTLGHERSFDQDPRFCLVVLSEIASRALSPGVNDPGTAISIIGVQQRLLTQWARGAVDAPEAPACPRVRVPALGAQDLFEDAFGPLLRDGAGMLEVGIRLHKALAVLAALGPPGYRTAAPALSAKALRLSRAALALDEDQARLATLAASVGADPRP